jgi:hypothetical protein
MAAGRAMCYGQVRSKLTKIGTIVLKVGYWGMGQISALLIMLML